MLQCQDFEFFFFSLLHQFIIVDLYFLIISGKSQGKLQINAFLCSKVVSLPLSNAIATSNLMKAFYYFLITHPFDDYTHSIYQKKVTLHKPL